MNKCLQSYKNISFFLLLFGISSVSFCSNFKFTFQIYVNCFWRVCVGSREQHTSDSA